MPIFKGEAAGSPQLVQQLVRIATGEPIQVKEWETLMLSALRNSDYVYMDDRIEGELRKYFRHSWDYWPFRFEAAWEIVGPEFTILSFTWKNEFNGTVGLIRDTAEFRGLLVYADQLRIKLLR